jgi:hypothetical protein
MKIFTGENIVAGGLVALCLVASAHNVTPSSAGRYVNDQAASVGRKAIDLLPSAQAQAAGTTTTTVPTETTQSSLPPLGTPATTAPAPSETVQQTTTTKPKPKAPEMSATGKAKPVAVPQGEAGSVTVGGVQILFCTSNGTDPQGWFAGYSKGASPTQDEIARAGRAALCK